MNYLVLPNLKFRDIIKASSTVYIPSGTYTIKNTLFLKTGVKIEGDAIESTVLLVDNVEQKDGSMFEIESGQVNGLSISNLTLLGGVSNNNPDSSNSGITKHCFYIKAKIGNSGNGGLWGASFKNLKILQFNGSGIVFEGGGYSTETNSVDRVLPNQAIIFENVGIFRQRHESPCLLIRGNHGQLTFINCGFDGLQYDNTASNTSFKTTKYFNVVIESEAAESAVVKFLTCTFQHSEYGVFIKYAETISFDNCWFEYLDNAIAITSATNYLGGVKFAKNITIQNSRFANASGFGSLWQNVQNSNKDGGGFPNGTCVSIENGSEVNVQNNYVIVSDSNSAHNNNFFVRNYSNDADINISGNTFQDPILSKTYGVNNKTINITNNEISTKRYKFVKINTSTNNIKEIKSGLSAGETITIKAIGTIKFDNSRNIIFSKPVSITSPFILNTNEVATFIKTDNGIGPINGIYYNETWHLISVNKSF